MKDRCYNANSSSYKYYGGRGIKVLEPWKSNSESFLSWYDIEYAKSSWEALPEVDRIDNNGHYCPENCRLVSRKENQRNKSSNNRISAFGVTMSKSEAFEKFANQDLKFSTFDYRIKIGIPVDLALKSSPRVSLQKSKKYKPGKPSTHPKYKTWKSIKSRTTNPTDSGYSKYGGRGIKMEEPWYSNSLSFIEWYESNCKGNYDLVVDRIDVNGNYSPNNCRLVTVLENNRNKRDSVMVTYRGSKMNIQDAIEKSELKLSDSTVLRRLKDGWSVDEALDTPPYGKVIIN